MTIKNLLDQYIRVRDDSIKISFAIGLRGKAYEPSFFKLCLMIPMSELCPVAPVLMILTFTESYRVMRNNLSNYSVMKFSIS